MVQSMLDGYKVNSTESSSATSGGVTQAKDLPYSPPKGPSNINDPKTPGLHGDCHPCGTQGKH